MTGPRNGSRCAVDLRHTNRDTGGTAVRQRFRSQRLSSRGTPRSQRQSSSL